MKVYLSFGRPSLFERVGLIGSSYRFVFLMNELKDIILYTVHMMELSGQTLAAS